MCVCVCVFKQCCKGAVNVKGKLNTHVQLWKLLYINSSFDKMKIGLLDVFS